MNTCLTVYTLCKRQLVRFYRQPSRVVGALGSPLLFWVVIGSGLGRSFQSQGAGRGMAYLEYFFPGTLLMILLFTAIFSTISIIEDRREGFLQAVLAAPVSRSSLVFGQILGGASLAFFQAMLFMMLTPFLGLSFHITQWLLIMIILFLGAVTLTGLGFAIAWQMNSIQGFHAIMNLFLLPLWLLSGALFPPEGASRWLQGLMAINPLSYQLALLRRTMYRNPMMTDSLPGWNFSWGVVILFSILMLAWATQVASKRSPKNVV